MFSPIEYSTSTYHYFPKNGGGCEFDNDVIMSGMKGRTNDFYTSSVPAMVYSNGWGSGFNGGGGK
jgi:hypothetical protein